MHIDKLKMSYKFKIISGFMLLLTSCTTEIISLNETSTVTGKIITRDEFGFENYDATGVAVSLDNTDFNTTTDENGVFVFEDVPTGSYDLLLEKSGYGSRIIHSVDIFAIQDTVDLKSLDLIQPSSIKIQNFRIEQEDYQLYACGTIEHKFPYVLEEGEYNPYFRVIKSPSIAIYFNDQDNVSVTNYIRNFTYDVFYPSKSEFRVQLNWVISAPINQGQTYYYIAYGESLVAGYKNEVYDPETGFVDYYPTLLGEASNVFTITKNN